MWDLIVGGATAILSGGATGLIGVGLQRLFDWLHVKETAKQRAADQAHEQAMKRIDGELMDKEWSHRTKVATIEGETAREVSANNAFAASFAAEPAQYSAKINHNWFTGALLALLDFVRGIIRPGGAITFTWMMWLLWRQNQDLIEMYGLQLPIADVVTMQKQIVYTILYLGTTIWLWFCGTRNRQTPPGVK